MKPNAIKKEKAKLDATGEKKTDWRVASLWLGAVMLLIAVFAVMMPESIPTGSEKPMCEWCVPPEDSVQEIAESLADQGYVLYTYGGCLWCDEQLAEFGDAAGSLAVWDCAMAHQAYRFENVSEAEAAYNWLYVNGSAVKASNLTYANLTVSYDGYGILGYANRNETCAALNMSGYPTWILANGTRVIGFRTLDVIRGWVA